VKLNGNAAVAAFGAFTDKCAAAPALTLTAFDVPAMEDAAVSVAAIVWPIAVLNVTEKFPAPFVSAEFPGNTAWLSLLEKCTVPG
jgi:hypothetical protein